jgi:hypothetical protein
MALLSLRKKCYRFFIALKICHSQPGLNPRPLGPTVSTMTITTLGTTVRSVSMYSLCQSSSRWVCRYRESEQLCGLNCILNCRHTLLPTVEISSSPASFIQNLIWKYSPYFVRSIDFCILQVQAYSRRRLLLLSSVWWKRISRILQLTAV